MLENEAKRINSPIRVGVSMRTAVSSEGAIQAINRNMNDDDHVDYFIEGISFIEDGLHPRKRDEEGFLLESSDEDTNKESIASRESKQMFALRAIQLAKQFFEKYDGLIIPGNDDNLDPYFYDPKNHPVPDFSDEKNRRALLELALVNEAINQNKPVLGLCGGHQVIAAATGAKLNDIEKLQGRLNTSESILGLDQELMRRAKPGTFPVAFHANTALHTIIEREATFKKEAEGGKQRDTKQEKEEKEKEPEKKKEKEKEKEKEDQEVEKEKAETKQDIVEFEFSFHRQAIDPDTLPPYLLMVSATDEQGIIKAIEVTGHPWMFGTQFHPEFFEPGSGPNNAIFKNFLAACHDIKQQNVYKKLMHQELTGRDVSVDVGNMYKLLEELSKDVNDPKWNDKAKNFVSSFFPHCPEGIARLRKNLLNLASIRKNNSKIIMLFTSIHSMLNQKVSDSKKRDPEVERLWSDYKKKFDDILSPEYRVKRYVKPSKSE